MIQSITAVRHLDEFRLWLRFSDGVEGAVDLKDELGEGIFAPLLDPAEFRKAALNTEVHTVVWPNGADFSPEFLREKLLVKGRLA